MTGCMNDITDLEFFQALNRRRIFVDSGLMGPSQCRGTWQFLLYCNRGCSTPVCEDATLRGLLDKVIRKAEEEGWPRYDVHTLAELDPLISYRHFGGETCLGWNCNGAECMYSYLVVSERRPQPNLFCPLKFYILGGVDPVPVDPEFVCQLGGLFGRAKIHDRI